MSLGRLLENVYYTPVLGKVALRIFEALMKFSGGPKPRDIGYGVKMFIDLRKPAERAIPYGAFEPVVTKRFMSILTDDVAAALDVGSWMGYYALLAATKARNVVAIEPVAGNVDRITRNVQLNGFTNMTVLQMSVGSYARMTSVESVEGSTSMGKVIETGGEIPMDSIDNVLHHCDLWNDGVHVMLMDIEGYEWNALQGMNAALESKKIKNIIMEVHPKFLEERHGVKDSEITDLLEKNGYKVEIFERLKSGQYHLHAY